MKMGPFFYLLVSWHKESEGQKAVTLKVYGIRDLSLGRSVLPLGNRFFKPREPGTVGTGTTNFPEKSHWE